MFCPRRNVIPLPSHERPFLARDRQHQAPLGDDADVFSVVLVWSDDCSGRVGGEKHVATCGFQLVRVKRTCELRQIAYQLGEIGHGVGNDDLQRCRSVSVSAWPSMLSHSATNRNHHATSRCVLSPSYVKQILAAWPAKNTAGWAARLPAACRTVPSSARSSPRTGRPAHAPGGCRLMSFVSLLTRWMRGRASNM